MGWVSWVFKVAVSWTRVWVVSPAQPGLPAHDLQNLVEVYDTDSHRVSYSQQEGSVAATLSA